MIVSFFFVYSCGIQVYRYLKTKLFPTHYDSTSEDSKTVRKDELVLDFPLASDGTAYRDSEGDIKFTPPVYSQRYLVVSDELERLGPFKKEICKMFSTFLCWTGLLSSRLDTINFLIVELGCNSLAFFPFLKHHEGIEEAVLVDLNRDLLINSKGAVFPLICDHIKRRTTPFRVRIFAGNAAVPDLSLAHADAVFAIELIEHMFPQDLFDLPYCVFEVVQPRLAVFTTPNADFNILFKHPERLRDPDHKFEWTRREFYAWAKNITEKYPAYDVSFKGIGAGPEGSHEYGTCSQMAVFVRDGSPNCDLNKFKVDAYELIEDVDYPFSVDAEPTVEEKLLYYLRKYFSYEEKVEKYYSYSEDQIEVPLQEIYKFLSHVNDDIDFHRKVLLDNGYMIKESACGEEVVIPPQEECSSSAGVDSNDGHESEEVLFSENGIQSDSDAEVWLTETSSVSPYQSDFFSSTPLPQPAAGDVPPSKTVCPLSPAREFLIDLQAFSAGDKTTDTCVEPTFLGSSFKPCCIDSDCGEGPSGVERSSNHGQISTHEGDANSHESARKSESPSRTRSKEFSSTSKDVLRVIDPIGLERTTSRIIKCSCPSYSTSIQSIHDLCMDSTNLLVKSSSTEGLEVCSMDATVGAEEKHLEDEEIKIAGERNLSCGWSGSPDICENWRNAANSESRLEEPVSELLNVDISQKNDCSRDREINNYLAQLPVETPGVSEISETIYQNESYSADIESCRNSSLLESSTQSPLRLDSSVPSASSNNWSNDPVSDESKVNFLQCSNFSGASVIMEPNIYVTTNTLEASSYNTSSTLNTPNSQISKLNSTSESNQEPSTLSKDTYDEASASEKTQPTSDEPDSSDVKYNTISVNSSMSSNYPASSSDSGFTARLPITDEGTSIDSKSQIPVVSSETSKIVDGDDSLLNTTSSSALLSDLSSSQSGRDRTRIRNERFDTICDNRPSEKCFLSETGCKLSDSVNNIRSETFESNDTVPSSVIVADTDNVYKSEIATLRIGDESKGTSLLEDKKESLKHFSESSPITKDLNSLTVPSNNDGATKDLNNVELDLKKDNLLQVPYSLSQSCDSAALCEQLSHTIEASQSEDNIVYKNVATGVNLISPCDTDASVSSNHNPLKSCLRLSINGNYEMEPIDDEKKEGFNKNSKEQTPINLNMLDFSFVNVKPEDQASVMNRCKSLQLIRDSAEKRANRFSLCCEKDERAESKLYGMGWSLEEVGGCWREETEGATIDDSRSQSRAADSGYPNTSDRDPDMDTDLTPEQVDELLSENDSSFDEPEEDEEEEQHVERPPLPGAAAPVQFVEHVENGDVANNNQDGEGNNMDGEEILAFDLVQMQPNEERQEAPARHDSDSEDENKYVSASESLLSETIVADEECKDDMDDTFDSDIWSSTPGHKWKDAIGSTPAWASPNSFLDEASSTPKNISCREEIRWPIAWDEPGSSTNPENSNDTNVPGQNNWTDLNSSSTSTSLPLEAESSDSAQGGLTSHKGDTWLQSSQPFPQFSETTSPGSHSKGPSYEWRGEQSAGPSFTQVFHNNLESDSPSSIRNGLQLEPRVVEWRTEPWEGLASSSSLIAHASSSSSLSPQDNQNLTFQLSVESDFPSWLRNIFVDDVDGMGDIQGTPGQNEASSDFLLLPEEQSLRAHVPADMMGGGEPHFQS